MLTSALRHSPRRKVSLEKTLSSRKGKTTEVDHGMFWILPNTTCCVSLPLVHCALVWVREGEDGTSYGGELHEEKQKLVCM